MRPLSIILLSTIIGLLAYGSFDYFKAQELKDNIEELRLSQIELVVAEQKMLDWGTCKFLVAETNGAVPDYYCNTTIGYAPFLLEDQRRLVYRITKLSKEIK